MVCQPTLSKESMPTCQLHNLQFVDALPPYLASPLDGPFVPLTGIDPRRPLTLRPYEAQLRLTRVLRLRCPALSVVWSDEVWERRP